MEGSKKTSVVEQDYMKNIHGSATEIIKILAENKVRLKDIELCFDIVSDEIQNQEIPKDIKMPIYRSRVSQ